MERMWISIERYFYSNSISITAKFMGDDDPEYVVESIIIFGSRPLIVEQSGRVGTARFYPISAT
jgi:hypothetical protein